MKKIVRLVSYKNKIIKSLLLICLLFIAFVSQAQTYATVELKTREENEVADKNKKAGIIIQDKTEEKIEVSKIKVADINYYIANNFLHLKEVKAVRIDDKYSEKEKLAFEQEAKIEHNAKDAYYNTQKDELIFILRHNNSVKEIPLTRIKNRLYAICEVCNIPDFEIVEYNNENVIIDVKNQDENAVFYFRYTFTNTK